MKLPISTQRMRRLIPFLIIAIFVIVYLERHKSGPLLPPDVTLLAPNMRSAEHTEVTLPDLAGQNTSLADFRGNIVLLNFFATWCPPCREEMPSLEELFQTYQHKGLVVIGVANDVQGKEVVEPFVRENKLTFPVLLDTASAASKQYRVRGLPSIYLLDRNGRIAGLYIGGADWNSKEAHQLIERLLEES